MEREEAPVKAMNGVLRLYWGIMAFVREVMLIHMVGVPAARQQQVRKAEEWLAARGKVEDDMQQPKDKRGSMAFKRGGWHSLPV
ncbi:hypothetical protein CsSME_00019906 [Camellia sinensis var. sinensis]